MFKTILTNILSIHKPKDNNPIMVKISVAKKFGKTGWWCKIDWHVFKLPNYDQSIIIDDIKIEAEIIE